MVLTLLALVVIGAVAFKVLTGAERDRARDQGLKLLKLLQHASRTQPEEQAFNDALKERTRWPFVTTGLIALNAAVFIAMLMGHGTLSDPDTLVGWGASLGPKTTNGEWWRLLTSLVIHNSGIQVVLILAALVQIGRPIERLIGPAAFAMVYFVAGLIGNLVNLSAHRATPGFGASGAVFGLYGVLIGYAAWQHFHRTSPTFPLATIKKMAPVAALFVLYHAVNTNLGFAAEIAGLAVGLKCALGLMMGATEAKPAPRRLAAIGAASLVAATLSALPLRGIADVWPELQRIVADEDRTARDFTAADQKFKKRGMTADALADLIDTKIVPELKASEERLKAIQKIPEEHQPLVESAQRYLELRSESWRLQAEGLRKIELRALVATEDEGPPAAWRRRAEAQHRANLATLGNAQGKARASLMVLEQIRTQLAKT